MNRNHPGAKALVASTMVLGLLALAACEKKADETMAADTMTAAPAAAPTMPDATVVDPTQLQTGAAALKGQTVRVNGATVVSKLGSKAFWFSLPNKNPFLVMTADNATVNPQDMVDVVGTVTVMNDSILNAWVSSGAITENQKLEAEFATEFIQAQAVQKAMTGGGMEMPPTKAPGK